MGRPSNTEARRAQITDALRRVMATRGYSGASIQAIAREAKLAPGLVHYHFSSKSEILLALVAELAAVVTARVHARVRALPEDAARERLDAWIDAHVALGSDADPTAVASWVVVGTEALRDDDVRAAYEQALQQDLDIVRGLVADVLGMRTDVDADLMARGLLASVEGCFRVGTAAPEVFPEGFAGEVMRGVVDAWLGEPSD